MPCYNGAPYLRESIASILSQQYDNLEVIVSDDCSTDDSVNVVKKIADTRIRLVTNESNLGYGRNLQRAAALARGEIIFLFAQDDVLLPGALQRTIRAFETTEVGVVIRPYYL